MQGWVRQGVGGCLGLAGIVSAVYGVMFGVFSCSARSLMTLLSKYLENISITSIYISYPTIYLQIII